MKFVYAIFLLILLPVIAAAQGLSDTIYDAYGVDFNGFTELANGRRLKDDPYEKDVSLADLRLQLELAKDMEWAIVKFKGDMLWDMVTENLLGRLREGSLLFSPLESVDVKIGRQVLTWGTGDLLFINDLFPKDWQSFFIGRDDEYLKAPSDAVKISFFSAAFDLDLIFTPVFDGSDYIKGCRLSYWNNMLGRTAGRDAVLHAVERSSMGRDSEYSLRLSKNINNIEFAFYGYSGFWKTPEGYDYERDKLYYPRLSVYGFSIRSTLWGGIGNFEAGYCDSREDRKGRDPLIRNSEYRFLAGFERELAPDFTGGFQYYLEWMADYENYQQTLPETTPRKDEYRNVFTLRLTRLLLNQNLSLSLFCYYSPTDEDAYLRPQIHYKVTDQWAVDLGANVFTGSENHTFFGQFDDNSNIYARLRWSF